jgi:(1->4)-alpha-D-glucan 1-alpha-D-glucosylmutase
MASTQSIPNGLTQQPVVDQKAIDQTLNAIAAQCRIPSATYRLQFHGGFTFKDARALVDYLDALGISDLYASPLFLPRAGSTHGYDVSDPTQLNSDLGGEEDFNALSGTLQKREMGLVLDIVPNHMGINDPRNRWWFDVLENGPSSEYASFFDIEWHPIQQDLENQVLLPILGGQYGIILERGEIKLSYANGSFHLNYWETELPLSPGTYDLILRPTLERMRTAVMDEEPISQLEAARNVAPSGAIVELESILTAISYLPPRTETDPTRLTERAREKEIVKRRLAVLFEESEQFREALTSTVTTINGEVGNPRSFDLLDMLIAAQPYRPAFWRVAGEEINYRRFFDINDLAAIRVEDPAVFEATHALALQLLAEGKATGLRIDHPDGLNAPVTYFRRLQEAYFYTKLQAHGFTEDQKEALKPAIDHWLDRQARNPEDAQWPLYVVVEKILSESEPLPPDWSVHGTTGYDFLASANGIFVDGRNERAFTRLYSRFTGNTISLTELSISTKMMIMRDSLAGEIATLAYELERIGEHNRHYRDFTLGGLRTALREVIGCLGIYRTYIDAHQGTVSERDRRFMNTAVRAAKRRHPLLDDSLFDYIQDTVLLRNMESFPEEDRPRVAQWVMKFQQITGPVMAKGVEDTAFYRYNRLVSLNEVGDHPGEFGTSIKQFHQDNQRRARLWPHSMLATSTHDNKRSEDVRARINLLSEMPDLWQKSLRQWNRLNESHKTPLEGAEISEAPDTNDEYLFYQILLGAWPIAQNRQTPEDQVASQTQEQTPWGDLLQPGDTPEYHQFRQRIVDYMLKAAKEAKVYTSWSNANQEYEDALQRFVEKTLHPIKRNRFLTNFAPFARRVAYFGQFNALGQTLLKLTAPGVPDIYQGNELWDFSLVDPDNRREVDYGLRRTYLKQLATKEKRKGAKKVQLAQELVEQSSDGRIKLYVTSRTLAFRRQHEALFANGAYIPIETSGKHTAHLCAYLRRAAAQASSGTLENAPIEQVIVVVPRLVATLTAQAQHPPTGAELWGETWLHLPAGDANHSYRNLYTGESLAVVEKEGQKVLAIGEVLANFPVALLTPEHVAN